MSRPAGTGETPARVALRVEGVVQGVGFRPYVYALARRLRLGGHVGNDAHGVFVEVEGDPSDVEAFVSELPGSLPPLATVERVVRRDLDPRGEIRFTIVESERGAELTALVSPDVATCEDCLREVFDPADRRHCYAFTNCTNCGPRFTIIRGVPYDRAATTMAGFPMCGDCAREYEDPLDRRFHAQPVCCPACGPRLRLVRPGGAEVGGDPVEAAAQLLGAGEVVAVKGLGGYHLAVVADDETAARALRARKHREERPFALMAADLDAAHRLCHIDAAAAAELTAGARPIVVLPRRGDADVAPSVAPDQQSLGLMLPYTPLHHLLARALGRPFVLTSGNVSDEPIAYQDADALERLSGIAAAFLTHDRPIHRRVDDSVVRVLRDRVTLLRRSRGYVPRPVAVPRALPRPVLACGAQLKNTFCLAAGRRAFVSHHIGDLENYETLRSFTEGVEQFRALFDISPVVVAHDLHPDYLSSQYAVDSDLPRVGVQHHHAHVAACLADNGEAGPVLGVAFDGLGYGPDGTLWGGEVLIADLAGYERAAWFEPVPLPGGAAAVRQPWRMAAAYLDRALGGGAPVHLAVYQRHAQSWGGVLAAARAGVNAPLTSSVGRLFDAVAAITGVRDAITYEGQAAIELELRADPLEAAAYDVPVEGDRRFRLRGDLLVAAAAEDVAAGVPVERVAARFHNGLAAAVVDVCRRLREQTGLGTVALSGGVWQNLLLVRQAAEGLESAGFRVLTHAQVPPNDGGISLGQAVVAGAQDVAG